MQTQLVSSYSPPTLMKRVNGMTAFSLPALQEPPSGLGHSLREGASTVLALTGGTISMQTTETGSACLQSSNATQTTKKLLDVILH